VSLKTPVEFIESLEYAAWSPDHGISAWKNQTANLDIGRVFVKDPQQYGLVSPERPSDVQGLTPYPVALFHQLHCLVCDKPSFRVKFTE